MQPRRHALLAVLVVVALAAPVGFPAARATGPPSSVAPVLWGDFAPPFPGDLVVRQPDGSSFKAVLTGAEIGGRLEHGGFTVTRGPDGWWRYDRTDARVGLDDVPAGLAQAVGRHRSVWLDEGGGDLRTQALRQLQIASYKASRQAAVAGGPRVFRFPVLMLATWWDAEAGQGSPQFQAGNTAAAFGRLLDGFGGNRTGSLTEFYFENSFGQFVVQVDVFGPYTSQRSRQDRCYYGGIDASADPADDLDPLDLLTAGGGGAIGMAVEAVPQADPDVDFSVYDNDGDGVVDFTALLHSGPDMSATGDPCHTWSHATQVGVGGAVAEDVVGLPPHTLRNGVPTSDGVTVDRVFTMPEIDLEIGVAAHEMAHALGEPDYYDTAYTSMGTGDWDIMAGGSWFGNPPGSNPTGFNPASRVFQGWITPKVVTRDETDVQLAPRELQPFPNYTVDKTDPNVVLVPVETAAVGETDDVGHSWTEEDTYGLVDVGGRFVIEGYYLETWSRSVNAPAFDSKMSRQPYFDRVALGSGLMVWHFDYHRRSNVYFGANDAQTDPNRPQMDPVEFDYNDNTQELQLGFTRGEPQDLVVAAATGITSGTHRLPPLYAPVAGEPQASSTWTGTVPPFGTDEHTFTVDANPANRLLRVGVVSSGDCTIQLVAPDGSETEVRDSSGFGEAEPIDVERPAAGRWTARVGDFALCGAYEGSIEFPEIAGVFDTRGAGDTWSSWTQEPTGWAFTNVRPAEGEGMDSALDAGPGVVTVDLLHLTGGATDVSPGSASPFDLDAGRANAVSIPVFNNGDTTVAAVGVTVRRGAPNGSVVARGEVRDLGPYSQRPFTFDYTPGGEGTVALYATVDAASVLAERSERNNTQRTIVEVSPAGGDVLVVDDDGAADAQDSVTGPLSVLGIAFDVVRPPVDAALLQRYRAVVWEAGLERYQGQLDADDRAAIAAYLGSGGRLLYASPRAAAALGEPAGPTNPLQVEGSPKFLADWFGASYRDTVQVGGGIVSGTGDILGADAWRTGVFPGRPLQDVFALGDSAVGTATPVARWDKGGDGSLMAVRVEGDSAHGSFRSVFLGFNPSQVLSADATVTIVERALGWLGVAGDGAGAGADGGRGYPDPPSPVLRHTSVRTAMSGAPIEIIAFVRGRSTAPTLTYRRHGGPALFRTTMTRGRAGVFQATIPAEVVGVAGVDYVIDARPARSPFTRDLPHYVSVGLPG